MQCHLSVFLWCGRGPCVLQCVHVCVMCKGLVFMKTYSVPDLSSGFTSFRSTYSLILAQNVAGFFFFLPNFESMLKKCVQQH